MATTRAMDMERARLPPTAKDRPSVYDPTPYLNGPRHEFLNKCVPSVNPRILSRAVDLAMHRRDPCMRHCNPPLLALQEASPNTFSPHVDPKRTAEVFGYRTLPNLRRDLDKDTDTVRRAITTICDIVHDPRRVSEALRVSLIPKVMELMSHEDETIRERCCAVVMTLASYVVGRDAVLGEYGSILMLKKLFYDPAPAVRFRAALALRTLSAFRLGPYDLDESDLAPFLVEVLPWETDSTIQAVHCQSLHQLLKLDSTKELCIFLGGIDMLNELMRKGDHEVTGGALEAMSGMATCPYGKQVADLLGILGSAELRLQLLSKNQRSIDRAVMVIMNLTHTIAGRKVAFNTNLVDPLMKLAKCPKFRRSQICALQALTNIAEYPPCRSYLRQHMFQLRNIHPADEDVTPVLKRLMDMVLWEP